MPSVYEVAMGRQPDSKGHVMRLQAKTAWGMGVALVLATCVAWAGGEDDECRFQGSAPATSATINHCADFFKTLLLGKGKLDASWKRVEIDSCLLYTSPSPRD